MGKEKWERGREGGEGQEGRVLKMKKEEVFVREIWK